MTSPMYSSGVSTSTAKTGSSSVGSALGMRRLERHRAGDLERYLGRVDVVVGAEGQRRLDVDDGVAGDRARLHRLADALVDRLDVLLRDHAAGDLVVELVALAGVRLERDHGVAVLAAAAGLAHELALHLLDLLADGLAVGDLRLADVGRDAELAHEAVDDDLEVQLAHAGDDDLAGLVVGAHAEGRDPPRRGARAPAASLSWSAFVLGSTARPMTGSGNVIDSSRIWCDSSHSVCPVVTCLRPTAAAISPAPTDSRSSRLLACIWRMRPTRSLRPVAGL